MQVRDGQSDIELKWQGLTNKGNLLIAGLLLLLSLALYVATLAPSTLSSDLSEYQFVLAEPGIPHPTGYPFYVLIGHLWSYLPVGTIAYRVNLFSALMGSLTVGLLYLTIRHLAHPAIAAGVALFVAAMPLFWSQMVIAGTYPLNALLFTALLYSILSYLDGRLPAEWLMLVYGLGLTHHRTTILLLPAMLFLLIAGRQGQWSWQRILRLPLVAALPLLFYLYIPIRAAQLGYEELSTVPGLLHYLSGNTFSGHLFTDGWAGLPPRLLQSGNWFQDNMTLPLLVLAAGGLILAFRRYPPFAAFSVLAFLGYLAFNLNYYIGNIFVYYIPIYLLFAVWLAIALQATGGRLAPLFSARSKKLAPLPFLLLGGALLFTSGWRVSTLYPQLDQSDNYDLENLWLDAFALPLPFEATVFSRWVEHTSQVYYQRVEKRRTDLDALILSPDSVMEALAEKESVFVIRVPREIEYPSLSYWGPLIEIRTEPYRVADVAIPHPQTAVLSNGLRLLGYDFTYLRRDSQDNQRYLVTLYWAKEANEVGPVALSFRLHAGERLLHQQDRQLMDGIYPPERWQPEEVVIERQVLVLTPANQQFVSETELWLVVYDPGTLTPYFLQATDESNLYLGSVALEKSGK